MENLLPMRGSSNFLALDMHLTCVCMCISTTYSFSELFIDKQVIKIFILLKKKKKKDFILSSTKLLPNLITLSTRCKELCKWLLIKHTLHFMWCTEKVSGLVTSSNVRKGELKTQSLPYLVNHTFAQYPAFQEQRCRDQKMSAQYWVKGFWGLVEKRRAQHQGTPVLFLTFQSCESCLIFLCICALFNWIPLQRMPVKVKMKGRVFMSMRCGTRSLFWFPAHSFSRFVTLKITIRSCNIKLGITNPTYYTQVL